MVATACPAPIARLRLRTGKVLAWQHLDLDLAGLRKPASDSDRDLASIGLICAWFLHGVPELIFYHLLCVFFYTVSRRVVLTGGPVVMTGGQMFLTGPPVVMTSGPVVTTGGQIFLTGPPVVMTGIG